MSKGKIHKTKRRTRELVRKMQQIRKKNHSLYSKHGSKLSRVFDSTHNLLSLQKVYKTNSLCSYLLRIV